MVIVSFVFLNEAQAHWPEQDKLVASDGASDDHFGASVSISGDRAIVSAYGDDDNGSDSGAAYIFEPNDVDPNNWDQIAKLTASDGASDDHFGTSVSISGDYAIVGAYQHYNGGAGKAYIFKWNGTSWVQQDKLTASDGAAGDQFGVRVSISGDLAIVGANYDDDNGSDSGSAYIFKKSVTPGDPNWYQQCKLTASDAAAGDQFGLVSISGDRAIVGALRDDDNGTNSGSAYIFEPNDVDPNNWDQIAKLTASDGAAGDNFGHGVSISGDYAIVGAIFYDNGTESGKAYIFKWDGTSWLEQQKLDGTDSRDGFGHTVSISGDYAIVSASYENSFTGSAYIFQRDGQTWVQRKKLIASDGAAPYDCFGLGASISGDYAIVGSYLDHANGTDSGSAYIFNKVCPIGDIDNNCFVDFRDFAIMAGEWLQCN
ncbi:MAG: FG-GAP repeat protein [Phycisphaerae bacterium]|nr:FG-GAP repeat protein [Phycisphaerae bacterium]